MAPLHVLTLVLALAVVFGVVFAAVRLGRRR
jgi:hypothetical protein